MVGSIHQPFSISLKINEKTLVINVN